MDLNTVFSGPHLNGRVEAVGRLYGLLSGRSRVEFEQLQEAAREGRKVSLLLRSTPGKGASNISTTAGTAFEAENGPALMGKGRRVKGSYLSGYYRGEHIMDIENGYGGEAVLAERAHAVAAMIPEVEPIAQESLDALPERSNEVRLALFGTLRYPEGPIPGAIWLVSGYYKEDDVVESVLIVPPSQADSESGTALGRDLRRMDVGVVSSFAGMTYGEALALCDVPYEEALAAVRSRTEVQARPRARRL